MRLKKSTNGDDSETETFADLGIYEKSVFHALVRHERHRVDRDDSFFSLAVFSHVGTGAGGISVRSLCAALKSGLRSIDVIGWLDETRIGVLLPISDLEGAKKLAERILASPELRGNPIECQVFSYPDCWIESWEKVVDSDASADAQSRAPDILRIEIPRWKRVFDIAGAVAMIACLWPIFIIVPVYIKIVSPGPVLFSQPRVGYGRKAFKFFKFRTMKHGNSEGSHQHHIVTRIRSNESLAKFDNVDPRIIPGGRLLRKSCIDELPQLFNVLRGDMSLVGPRPCVVYEAKEYLRWHKHRFDVLPGMTGLWQVSGKNKLTFLQMIRLDISYARNMSLWNDIRILFLTVPAILGMVTESSFAGLNWTKGKKESQVENSVAINVRETCDDVTESVRT